MNPVLERTVHRVTKLLATVLVLGATACSNSSDGNAEYWLCAKPGAVTMPDGVSVAIWGYVADAENFGRGCAGEPTLPGPTLQAKSGTLTIHLRNLLPVPTSIVIPGQTAAMTPVWDDGTTGPRTSPTQRVRSFTGEAAPDGGVATYNWQVRPGTFLYHSGTHPQVQVQMGLYGGVLRDAREHVPGTFRPREAYAGVPYDYEALLLFSEIDPAQHLAIANGTYGTAPAPTSTLDYQPRYFLVNGKPYTGASPPLSLPAGKRTLLRFANAGLQSYAPTLNGMHMKMIAQDGHPGPWGQNPREQYSTLLPSLQTVDAIVVPPAPTEGTHHALYDRRLNLMTGAQPDGGMLARIEVR